MFQPYEAHVPFILQVRDYPLLIQLYCALQFFIDYDIFGMDLVHVDRVKFRISECRAREGGGFLIDVKIPFRSREMIAIIAINGRLQRPT